MAEVKFPTEVVDLPSKGLLYPKGSSLSSGKIEIKYMTAKEEDILTSANLIRKGKVIDSCSTDNQTAKSLATKMLGEKLEDLKTDYSHVKNEVSFSSKTKQNKKEKFSKVYKKGNIFFIEGSSYKGEAPEDFMIGTWWNHEIIKSGSQISTGSGRIIEQTVNFIGKEKLVINIKSYTALKFNFFSSDPSLSKD